MDTTEETKGAEGSKQSGKAKPKLTIKVRKSEKPKVAAQGVPPYEPPMMRRKAGSTMPEKTLGEHLLASFEKLEAEEVEKAKETAAKAKTTPQPKARSKSRKTPPMSKIQDPEYMETEDIEGPASGQITPGEVSVITDVYTVDMSMEEINLRNVLLEPKKWKLQNLDEIYDMLNCYCELQRIHKDIPDGDIQESEFRARVAERVRQFQTTKALLEQQKQWELEQEKCKAKK